MTAMPRSEMFGGLGSGPPDDVVRLLKVMSDLWLPKAASGSFVDLSAVDLEPRQNAEAMPAAQKETAPQSIPEAEGPAEEKGNDNAKSPEDTVLCRTTFLMLRPVLAGGAEPPASLPRTATASLVAQRRPPAQKGPPLALRSAPPPKRPTQSQLAPQERSAPGLSLATLDDAPTAVVAVLSSAAEIFDDDDAEFACSDDYQESEADAASDGEDPTQVLVGPSPLASAPWSINDLWLEDTSADAGAAAKKNFIKSHGGRLFLSETKMLTDMRPSASPISFGSLVHLRFGKLKKCRPCMFEKSATRTCRRSWLCDFCHLHIRGGSAAEGSPQANLEQDDTQPQQPQLQTLVHLQQPQPQAQLPQAQPLPQQLQPQPQQRQQQQHQQMQRQMQMQQQSQQFQQQQQQQQQQNFELQQQQQLQQIQQQQKQHQQQQQHQQHQRQQQYQPQQQSRNVQPQMPLRQLPPMPQQRPWPQQTWKRQQSMTQQPLTPVTLQLQTQLGAKRQFDCTDADEVARVACASYSGCGYETLASRSMSTEFDPLPGTVMSTLESLPGMKAYGMPTDDRLATFSVSSLPAM